MAPVVIDTSTAQSAYFCEAAPRREFDDFEVQDADFWTALVDGTLHVGSDLAETCAPFELTDGQVAALRLHAEEEGYLTMSMGNPRSTAPPATAAEGQNESSSNSSSSSSSSRSSRSGDHREEEPPPPPALPWDVDIARIAEAVVKLRQAGFDPSWVLVFDEVWVLIHQMSQVVERVWGNKVIFDFYAWYVDPRSQTVGGNAGWSPHRDRGDSDPRTSFRDNKEAKMNTVWVALSDATPDNSCLYVLPARHDDRYRAPPDHAPPPKLKASIFGDGSDFQNIRCLPALAGEVVMFSHRLLHWGSRGKPSAPAPRIALSWACSSDDYERPYLTRGENLPSPELEVRLALVAAQLIVYYQQVPLSTPHMDTLYALFMYQERSFDPSFTTKVREALADGRVTNRRLSEAANALVEAQADLPPDLDSGADDSKKMEGVD